MAPTSHKDIRVSAKRTLYSFSLSSASLAQKDTSGAEGISRNRRAVPILHGAGEAVCSCSSFSERSDSQNICPAFFKVDMAELSFAGRRRAVAPGGGGRAGGDRIVQGEMTLRYSTATSSDVGRVHALERASYPEDEAATEEGIRMRIAEAGEFFVLAETESRTLAGFVNGTLTTGDALTHESMESHEPSGHLLCIHSVVVEEKQRRTGVGLRMLEHYLERLRSPDSRVKEVRLICKDKLKTFYTKAGFSLIGPSAVVHGKEQWFEMKLVLAP